MRLRPLLSGLLRRRRRLGVSAAGLAAVTLVAALAPVAGAARAVVVPPPPGARADPAAPAHLLHVEVGPARHTTTTNWSGYSATSAGGPYSRVSSRWREPAVSCTATHSMAVFWVGLDGYGSGTVEQDGTLAECLGGVAGYYTWWEMYPTNAIQVVGTTVQPGDEISSSVVRRGTTYTLKVVDSTHPENSFRLREPCGSCLDTSAEWVAERPSQGGNLLPLPDYGRIAFAHDKAASAVASGSIAEFPHDAVTMINGYGQVLASPGQLERHGARFVDTWRQMQQTVFSAPGS